ncbi:trichohyalin-like isoform X3 [Actinia tenebrosa]|uniref:Trichohyalin-like isoform X3 n=1 Tax=Actinia tenebrosa TaxID=6105 RepID=A0A6P8ICM5_ACTTE|nr:trichohyalin-like isoform X3 [Actinia tenebrosa]
MDQGLMEARRWIERITFTPFKHSDFRESLVDGVLLCELVVNVASMSIGRINRSSTAYASTDNIKLFQRACETLGFDKSQLFDVTDLQEVPVKRGQSVLERAKESQRRLAKVCLTVYWLGKYANDTLNFTGSSSLDESCFQHLLQNQLPELPEIEGAEPIRHEPIETKQSEPSESIKDKHEIVTEAIDYSTNIQTFKQLEEESKRVQEEVERQRRRSFSASDKENQFIEEEKDRRRKSIGSKPVWKEGDSRYKHKKEILGGWKDPIKNRRDRIVQGGESPPKEKRIAGLNMRSPGDMRDKLSRFEQMNRQTSEESEVIQGKRSRPKSWGGGDSLTRGGSLVDKANKFESLQRQADKESAVLHGELRMPAVDNDDKRQNRAPVLSAATVNIKDKHSKYEKLDKTAHQQTMVLEGKHRENETDFEYDIGDKVSGPIPLPGTADVKLREKKRQFESLDYKAQRESSILKLHSGKSFDDATQRPKRSEPRPMSNVFDYQRSTHSYEPERSGDVVMRDVEGEGIQARDMNFVESSPNQNEVFMQNDYEAAPKPVSPNPPAPPREDSLRYNSLTKRPEDSIKKLSKNKTTLYSSFAQQPEEPNKGGAKRPALKYKEFISYPVTKQRDRVERYNAAVEQLSKEPGKKDISSDQSTGRPRKKSLGSDEWIKVRPVEEPTEDLSKRPIQKLWDREPEDEDTDHKKRSQPVDTSFTVVENSNYVPDVKNMRYKDFAAPPKSVVKDHVIMSNASVVESSGPRKISGIGPYSNFAQQAAAQDPNKPAPKVSMSYRDFVVPPPKEGSTSESEKAKAKKVKDLTKRFMELEAEQLKPKEGGPPQPKSLVDRDELVRYERESRARSWYGGPLGLDDEEFEGAYRRRVRRWSDYEYEEGDKTKSSPWEQEQEPEQSDDEMQSRKYPGTSAASSNQYQSYNGSVDPEIEVRKKPQVESSREWHQPQPPRSVEPLHDEIEVRKIPQVESSREWHQPQPASTEYPQRSVEPLHDADPIPYGQTHEQDMRPTISMFQHSEPEAPQHEDQSSSGEDRRYGPTTSTHARTIGTRSWNEFESSRRKKSMELLDNRPSAKPYDSKEQQKVKGEADIYKLKRPADYLPKYKADQADKPSSQPSYHEPPKPEDTYHHYFQSKTLDDFVPQEKYPQSQPEKYDEEPMPTSYPTYYQQDTDDQYRKGVATEVVQAGKPLIVSAKLHDKTKDQKPVQKPIPGDQAYEIVATTETSNIVESTQDFKAQQKLWEDLSSHKQTQPVEEPTEAFQVKELQAEKHVAMQPDIQKPRKAETHEREVEPVVTKSKRPQMFAIVGQGRQVRPLVAEVPEPVVVSQKHPKEEVPQLDNKEEPRAIPDQTRQQHPANVLISPSLSGAKVFNFDEDQNKKDAAKSHPHTEKQLIPAKKNETVVVETVTVVEKSRGFDEDIFKALELSEDERLKRNIQNPEYREKLRKEVEEKNRKQREEAKHLTNLQMRQSLGTKDMVNDGEGRLRQEHAEGLENAGGNLEYLYDYNANRTEDYARKDDPRYYANQRNRPNQRQYEIDRREQERSENERLRQEHLHRERLKQQQMEEELEEKREWERREQARLEYERREQERLEHERREQERKERERKEQERREWERREQERMELARREQERLEHERREQERKERERKEQERREWERREQERMELDRREQERLEHERQEQRRKELEQRERERKEQERREWERREQERLELARREQERLEHERQEQRRKELEQRERERKEQERREWERREQERLELKRQEQERLEHERREQERKERERKEQERREWERREQERLELERQEQERLEHERREQERKECERKEQERREWERREQERLELERREQEERLELERREQERLEHERLEQERLEHERLEQERLEHERVEQQFREQERKEQERMEEERRRREQLEREKYEQNRRRQDEQRQRGRYGTREHERHDHRDERHDPRETHMRHDYRDVERHDPRDTHRRHHRDEERHDPRDTHRRHHRDEERHDPRDTHRRQDHRDEERYDPRKRESHDYRDRQRYERERIQRERREQERLDQERRERERRERHRREQEHLGPEERERHRLEQQRRVHEMVEQQQREEEEYKKSLSREDVHIHAASQQGPQTDSNTNWTKIEDGSRYSIYETFIAADQKRVVCTSCGIPINKDTALFVQELNRYWHKKCFRCVVCQVIFGSKEQRSPLMVSDSLLHCENCFITNEGEKYTEV